MTSTNLIHVGIVGATRGLPLRAAWEVTGVPTGLALRIHALCDTNADRLSAAAAQLGQVGMYTDYEEMLARSGLDAVLLATPMPLHVPQAVAALNAGLHVLSEVPAAVSVDECRTLVAACRASRAGYWMAENYIYGRPVQIVRTLVERGLFGVPYYAEGEYIHELKELNEVTPWRRRWQTGINGVTYGTHSLGPILAWLSGDRVEAVCCAGSGHHYRDPRGDEYENEDSCVMLCKLRSGGLAKVRVDMLSERPHAMTNYQLQGSEGCFESARAAGERDRVWLRSRSPHKDEWQTFDDLADEFLPDDWRRYETIAGRAGHGGGDFFVALDFARAVEGQPSQLPGIHEALDITLPGLVSQKSIAEGGRWLSVPDSRAW
jgi:predicted dehydrogenase